MSSSYEKTRRNLNWIWRRRKSQARKSTHCDSAIFHPGNGRQISGCQGLRGVERERWGRGSIQSRETLLCDPAMVGAGHYTFVSSTESDPWCKLRSLGWKRMCYCSGVPLWCRMLVAREAVLVRGGKEYMGLLRTPTQLFCEPQTILNIPLKDGNEFCMDKVQ